MRSDISIELVFHICQKHPGANACICKPRAPQPLRAAECSRALRNQIPAGRQNLRGVLYRETAYSLIITRAYTIEEIIDSSRVVPSARSNQIILFKLTTFLEMVNILFLQGTELN